MARNTQTLGTVIPVAVGGGEGLSHPGKVNYEQDLSPVKVPLSMSATTLANFRSSLAAYLLDMRRNPTKHMPNGQWDGQIAEVQAFLDRVKSPNVTVNTTGRALSHVLNGAQLGLSQALASGQDASSMWNLMEALGKAKERKAA